MVKRRARLSDENDPLSSTDRVLAGFEQIGKSASQQPNQLSSQEVDTSASQQPNQLSSQEVDTSTSQQPNQLSSQEVDTSTSQQLTTLELTPSEPETKSQQDSNVSNQEPTAKKLISSDITTNRETKSQQPDKSTSQQDSSIEKPKLRKSTFQISETVLNKLDQVHLTLQLELGKAIAPYKEVIVEEALVRLLEQFVDDRSGLIEVLVSRQKSRDKP